MYYVSWLDLVGLVILGFILGYIWFETLLPYLFKIRVKKKETNDETTQEDQINMFLTEVENMLKKMYTYGVLDKFYLNDFKKAVYYTAHDLLAHPVCNVHVKWVFSDVHYTVTIDIDEKRYELVAPWRLPTLNPEEFGIKFTTPYNQ